MEKYTESTTVQRIGVNMFTIILNHKVLNIVSTNPDILFLGKWGLYNRKVDFTTKPKTEAHIFTGIWLDVGIKLHNIVDVDHVTS